MKRKTIEKVLVLVFFVCFCMYGCDYDNETELYNLEETCDTTNISFSGFVEPLITTNCAIEGCHLPGNGRILLRNYQEIKANVENGNIPRRAVRNRDMPPDGPLAVCDINKLDAWIKAGAPDN